MDDQHRLLEVWGKLMGEIPSATAILDQFLQRTEFFQRGGNSCCLGVREKCQNGPRRPSVLLPINSNEKWLRKGPIFYFQ